jgi:hypothetical protein
MARCAKHAKTSSIAPIVIKSAQSCQEEIPRPGSPRREHGTPSRWDQYWALLVAKRIPQQAQRWYVTHVQDFLDAVQPNSLKDLSREEITGYLQQTSSQGKWQDWQFRQVVDALQLLLVDLAGVKAAQLVDWDYWREAGITVTLYHLH